MTRRTVTLMQELPHFLRSCSVEELYQLARALRHDLARRGLLSTIEADALLDVLLGEARTAHRAIFSADCGYPRPIQETPMQRAVLDLLTGPPPAEKS